VAIELVVRRGQEVLQQVKFDRDAMVLGRSSEADLRLDYDGVSRRHARVTRGAGRGLNLVDLGAKNGTWLNGEKVDVASLQHGDLIQVGDVEVEVVLRRLSGEMDAPPIAGVGELEPRLGLSAREWEVAVEVSRGVTNAEIAKTLGISRRTVATHLERIYQRLGIHSRAALASLVVAHNG
jgi:pSer/pThr/pTyr-binding forkhead associated (FHA) protein